MKRLFKVILAFTMMMSIVGCGSQSESKSKGLKDWKTYETFFK